MSMRIAATLLALVACGSSSEPRGGGLRPDEIVTMHLEHVQTAIEQAQLDRKLATLQKRLDADSDISVTTEVAKLVPGWNTVQLNKGQLVDLWAVWAEGNDVIVAGHSGWMARSRDGGASWKAVDPKFAPEGEGDGAFPPLIAELHGSGDHLLAIGFENKLVAVSSDRGSTWRTLALTLPSKITEGENQPIEPSAAWVAGRDAYIVVGDGMFTTSAIFVSHDFGETWKLAFTLAQHSDTDTLSQIAGTPDGSEVYVGAMIDHRGAVFRSRDRGATWVKLPMPAHVRAPGMLAVAGRGDLYSAFSENDVGDTVMRPHAIAHSRDGGATWTTIPVAFKGPPSEITDENWWDVNGVYVGPDKTIYAAINGRATEQLESSHDGGATWTLERSASVRALAFANGAIFAVGFHATVDIRRP